MPYNSVIYSRPIGKWIGLIGKLRILTMIGLFKSRITRSVTDSRCTAQLLNSRHLSVGIDYCQENYTLYKWDINLWINIHFPTTKLRYLGWIFLSLCMFYFLRWVLAIFLRLVLTSWAQGYSCFSFQGSWDYCYMSPCLAFLYFLYFVFVKKIIYLIYSL